MKKRQTNRMLAAFAILIVAAACSDSPTGTTELPSGSDLNLMQSEQTASLSMEYEVVMNGLMNPRGMAWGPDGSLFVAEAGELVTIGGCAEIARGQNCISNTGAITRYRKGIQQRIASGLPSVTLNGTEGVDGPHHISFHGNGAMMVTVGWGGDPAARSELGRAGKEFGSIIHVNNGGQYRVVADVADFEGANNPDGLVPDSNPYGILSESGRHFVVDAGGNTLLEVRNNGRVSLVATFPQVVADEPFGVTDAVPTQVRRGSDGALYVSTLTGVPFQPGLAAIYKVEQDGTLTVHAAGLTSVTDFDIAPNGTIYTVSFGSAPFLGGPGVLSRIDSSGNVSMVSDQLITPTGVLIGSDGSVYVTNRGVIPGQGEVIRFSP
ncbi:MAG: ScyD/ScyE family protein [Balneolaceae bacterium]|nr:ScyD/ScyE family protein [Balneolaceae bacterium]